VLWDSPAFNAGISPGMTITAVNGKEFSGEVIKDAVKAKQPFDLLVKNFDSYKTVRIDYTGGLVYPHLERDASRADWLSELLKAKK